jgi:hypothetical protein
MMKIFLYIRSPIIVSSFESQLVRAGAAWKPSLRGLLLLFKMLKKGIVDDNFV